LERATNGRPYKKKSLLSVEIPYVFAVLFEAAKAKFPQCNNRVCLAKNAERFLRVTRDHQPGS
jgi:hypothetical protein